MLHHVLVGVAVGSAVAGAVPAGAVPSGSVAAARGTTKETVVVIVAVTDGKIQQDI